VGGKKVKQILWIAPTEPNEAQLIRLKGHFGLDVQVAHRQSAGGSAQVFVDMFEVGEYEDWVVVSAQSVIGLVCELANQKGLKRPLYAKMQPIHSSSKNPGDLNAGGRWFRFQEFVRVKRAALEFEEERF
jgi:hypothetical protein